MSLLPAVPHHHSVKALQIITVVNRVALCLMKSGYLAKPATASCPMVPGLNAGAYTLEIVCCPQIPITKASITDDK